MSTLTFLLYLDDEPHKDDLFRMQIARAIISSATDVPPEKLPGGLRNVGGPNRIATFSIHAARLPYKWIEAANALTQYYRIGYDYIGEIEEVTPSITVEMEREGKRYKGVLTLVEDEQ